MITTSHQLGHLTDTNQDKFTIHYQWGSQWNIFIILIVSCTNVIVAPGNWSIITSVGMKVYNIVLISLHMYIMRYGYLKIMIFLYILYCGGQPCPPQYKMYNFKSVISYVQSL